MFFSELCNFFRVATLPAIAATTLSLFCLAANTLGIPVSGNYVAMSVITGAISSPGLFGITLIKPTFESKWFDKVYQRFWSNSVRIVLSLLSVTCSYLVMIQVTISFDLGAQLIVKAFFLASIMFMAILLAIYFWLHASKLQKKDSK